MKKYRQLIKELPSKTVVFAFGRFNPPTTGHELLIKVVQKLAKSHNADHVIYASRTQDKKKNPLSVDRKIHYLKLMFKGVNFAPANDQERTFIEVARALNKKYKNIIMVAGSDRVPEYEKLLNTYNGKDFHFDAIQVVSAGERDPDADDAAGMSASKMRALATKGDYKQFKKGLPSSVRDIDGKLLMNEIRHAMGLESIKEQIKFNVDELREKYFKGEIFQIGDLVESNGQQFEIMDRGSNYLTVVNESGELSKKWIKDVQIVEIKNFKQFNEDIQPGPAPKEITYKGYTTKNLHHSADAAKAFQSTIDRAEKGLVPNDPVAILNALKSTDTYMKLNDMHLEQGKKPDEKETQEWIQAHDTAKKALEKVGEFPHHLGYWEAHKTELQFMGANKPTDMEESLSVKTIKPAQDKLKVARVLADMLGVNDVEKSSNPEQLINAALRKLKSKQINKDLLGVVSKMLDLADEVGIKYDSNLRPQKLKEQKDDLISPTPRTSNYNLATDILRYSDYMKLKKMNKGLSEAKPAIVNDMDDTDPDDEDDTGKAPTAAKVASKKLEKQDLPHTTPGHTLDGGDEQIRRRKVKYATEDLATADYKTNKNGHKYRAGRISFANSGANSKPDDTPNENEDETEYKNRLKIKEEKKKKTTKVNPIADDSDMLNSIGQKGYDPFFKEEYEPEEFDDKILDKIADNVSEDDVIEHCYDDDEFVVVDDETGEEIKEEVELVSEVLSRIERIRAKTRFARTASKRERKVKIALKRYSSAPVINNRARKLAIQLMKKRLARKPLNKLSVGEKERIEKFIQKRKNTINRLAMRLVPRIRKIEKARLTHSKATKGGSGVVF